MRYESSLMCVILMAKCTQVQNNMCTHVYLYTSKCTHVHVKVQSSKVYKITCTRVHVKVQPSTCTPVNLDTCTRQSAHVTI